MLRAIIFVLLLAGSLGSADDSFARKLVSLEIHFDPLFRRYFNCPEDDGARSTDCRPGTGKLDRKEFAASRRAAAILFDLQEKK